MIPNDATRARAQEADELLDFYETARGSALPDHEAGGWKAFDRAGDRWLTGFATFRDALRAARRAAGGTP